MLHVAEIADVSREGSQYGVQSSFSGIDVPAVNAFRDGIISKKYKGLQGLLKARGVTVIDGVGTLTSATSVSVGDDEIIGKHVVLATGSYSKTLPGLEITGRVITSEHALEMVTLVTPSTSCAISDPNSRSICQPSSVAGV
jgi:dihydrolipoamide dehydrogenase